MSSTKHIVVLPGDGIGPEVTEVALRVLERALAGTGLNLKIQEADLGGIAIDRTGQPFPDATKDAVAAADAVLLGAVGGPKWDNLPVRPEAGLLGIRKFMEVFANLRPFTIYPTLRERSPLALRHLPAAAPGAPVIQGMIIRELTGGLYFGEPRVRQGLPDGDEEAVDTLRYRRSEIARLVRVGFEMAASQGLPLISIDKANVLISSRLWRETVEAMRPEYPTVSVSHQLVDSAAMDLVVHPERYRLAVTENLFGDILSDLAGGLTGSLGLLPSASLKGFGADGGQGLYEPVHGSAPDIAGQDRANPVGAILSTALLCRYSLRQDRAASAIESAVVRIIESGVSTPDLDLAKPVGCQEFGRIVAEAL